MLDQPLSVPLMPAQNLNTLLVVHFDYFVRNVIICLPRMTQIHTGDLGGHRFGIENYDLRGRVSHTVFR